MNNTHISHMQKNAFVIMNQLVKSICVVAGFFFITLHLSCNRISQDNPNIILIMVDDLGFSDLGCYGIWFHKTNN